MDYTTLEAIKDTASALDTMLLHFGADLSLEDYRGKHRTLRTIQGVIERFELQVK